MNNLRLLLLEDLDHEAEALIVVLKKNNYDVVRVRNSEEAEKEIKNQFFDIIILDIMIDGKQEGISLAERMNKQQVNVPFLFLTSMQSKAVFEEAKFTNPYSYLFKPYNELELLYALELAIEKHYDQDNAISFSSNAAVLSPTYLFVKKGESVIKLDVSTIIYVEVEEKYCSLQSDEEKYLVKMPLKKVVELLANDNFTQVHRSFLINKDKIKELYFEDNLIIMTDNTKIPFSERHKISFKRSNRMLN